MTKSSDAVKRWRVSVKKKLILIMGESCQICGYNRCDAALEFHHIDPRKKDVSWGTIRSQIKSLETILKELQKCVMLCSNCHKEIHYGDLELPKHVKLLSDNDVREILNGTHKKIPRDKCPGCGELKFKENKTCGSGPCAARYASMR